MTSVAAMMAQATEELNNDPEYSAGAVCASLQDFTAAQISGDIAIPANAANVKMKPVMGGVFFMGNQSSDRNLPNFGVLGERYTHAVHQVGVSSFFLSETEITQGLYKSVMRIPDKAAGNVFDQGDIFPVHSVSWYDAIAFCNKLSLLVGREPCYSVKGVQDWAQLAYTSIPTKSNKNWNSAVCDFSKNGFRLPTEAEWEYAARGGQENEYTRTLGATGEQHLYSGSNDIEDVAWFGGNTSSRFSDPGFTIKPVGQKAANELGLKDMSGNVYEWCWDWYDDYQDGCQTNPTGSATGDYRVLRGGNWYYKAIYCRVSDRYQFYPDSRYSDIGFRIAISK
jgi:formylglycine-generating enzyme required for sulfatase activity